MEIIERGLVGRVC